MGFHTYPVERADALEDRSRYRHVSVEELLALIDPDGDDRMLDLGSGTGFYTDDVAPHVGHVLALDVQTAMHRRYQDKGVPPTVSLLTGEAGHLPVRDSTLDAVVSTMTYHEFAGEAASTELRRVLRSGGRLGIADWSRAGAGADGPPLDERHDAVAASEHLESAGFEVTRAEDRRETFVLSARVP
jgi:Methylase involved in ubiquinone/menaquinone biosynthesis